MRMLSLTKAANMLGISWATMKKIANTPGFPAVRVGKRFWVDKEGLEKWIENGGNKNLSVN